MMSPHHFPTENSSRPITYLSNGSATRATNILPDNILIQRSSIRRDVVLPDAIDRLVVH